VARLLGPTGSGSVKSLEAFASCTAEADSPTAAFFGDQGHIPLLSLRSRQWTGSLKMNGTARCGAFSRDGLQLVTAGGWARPEPLRQRLQPAWVGWPPLCAPATCKPSPAAGARPPHAAAADQRAGAALARPPLPWLPRPL
jgi:hypothetical protein